MGRWGGWSRITGILTVVATMGLGTACEGDPAGVERLCIPIYRVVVGGVTYEWDATVAAPTTPFPTSAYATVVGIGDACQDVIVNGVPLSPGLQEGESSFLPAGTKLYAMAGWDPARRLVTEYDGQRWVMVAVE